MPCPYAHLLVGTSVPYAHGTFVTIVSGPQTLSDFAVAAVPIYPGAIGCQVEVAEENSRLIAFVMPAKAGI